MWLWCWEVPRSAVIKLEAQESQRSFKKSCHLCDRLWWKQVSGRSFYWQYGGTADFGTVFGEQWWQKPEWTVKIKYGDRSLQQNCFQRNGLVAGVLWRQPCLGVGPVIRPVSQEGVISGAVRTVVNEAEASCSIAAHQPFLTVTL